MRMFVCLFKDFVVSCECLFVCLFKDFVVSCECNRHLKSLNLFIKYLAIRNIMLFRSVWGIERYLMILGATSADIEQVRRYRRKIIHQEVSEEPIMSDRKNRYLFWGICGLCSLCHRYRRKIQYLEYRRNRKCSEVLEENYVKIQSLFLCQT